MQDNSMMILKVLLWLICAAHISLGVGLNVSNEFVRLVADIYGAQVEWTPQFIYILKPLGAFMFVLGVLAAMAARNPLGHRVIVNGFVLLFVIRACQRLVYQSEIHDTFAIAVGRNLVAMIFFFALGALLFVLYRYVEKSAVT